MAKKKTYYFPHDSNAREDDKLVALRMRHGSAGYGVYFMLLESLSTAAQCQLDRNYNSLGYVLHESAGLIKAVVEDFGLFQFTANGERFYSERLSQHMQSINEVSQKRSRAGKKGLEKRWGVAIATENDSKNENLLPNPIAKEIKENNIIERDNARTREENESEVVSVETLYEEFKKEISTNTITAENAMRLYKKSREEILQGLADFQSTLIVDGETAKTRSDYRRHFNRWFALRVKEGGKRPQRTATTAKPSDTASRLHVSKPVESGFHSDI